MDVSSSAPRRHFCIRELMRFLDLRLLRPLPIIPKLINSMIGVGAFILTCLVIHGLLSFPQIEGISEKLRFFAAHKNEFDTLFIGSSRIHFQISPAIFDRAMRESGSPTHSFNFGVGGMNLPESAYVLEQILKTKPRNLRWVFIELGELQTKWPPEIAGSRRALYWHDWKRTSLVLQKIADAGTDPIQLPNSKFFQAFAQPNTRSEMIFHLTQFEKNLLNFSRADDLFDPVLRSETSRRDASANYLGPAKDGYVAKSNKEMPADKTATYKRALTLMMKDDRPRYLSPYAIEACRQCAEKLRSIGALPIFLIPPTSTQLKIIDHGAAAPPGLILAFNDPDAYPTLYRSNVRRDEEHLTNAGSEEFTRMLATKFAQFFRVREAP
jgi:hypothetical protein